MIVMIYEVAIRNRCNAFHMTSSDLGAFPQRDVQSPDSSVGRASDF